MYHLSGRISTTVLAILMCFAHDAHSANASSADSELSSYAKIRRELLSRSEVADKVPPGGGASRVNVTITLTPIDILDVDDVRQVVTATAYIRLTWRYPALSWNCHDPVTLQPTAPFSVLIPSSEIWRPEVLCANGATTEQSNIGRSLEDNAVVHKDGTVEVKANLNLEFTCKMDLTFFPFDTQRCRVLLFVTSTVPISSIPEDYQLLQADALRKLCSVGAEWTFVEQSVEEKEVPVLGGGSAVYLEYTITMTRKTTFFVISFIVPIVLTSYMNTVVFLIPVESGDRISYLVSIFVSTAVFVGFSTDTMPQGLNEIPLIMYFITGIMMESAVLIILVSLALHRYHDHQQQAEASDSDKDHESRTAANGHKYAPANHALHNIGNGHAATNQALRDITDPSHETFKIDKSDWRKKDGGETPRERAKKLDMILFVHTFVINSVFVASIIGCLVIQKD